ncbi:MAG: 3-hydroxyacyl-CoA dehydrogenase family protein [Reyranellaceae bacterium]
MRAGTKLPRSLKAVAIVGNGIIGHGVAQVFAMAGRNAVMIGRTDASLRKAVRKIETSLHDFVRHGLLARRDVPAVMKRIATSTRLEAAASAQLVIEAVTEDLALKRKIFARLDRLCPPAIVLASSSGQPASALAGGMRHPERVIAAHFWFPPQLIPLVEVCGGPQTSPAVVHWVAKQLKAAGKEPVVIDREIPGFIGGRLQFALLREAWSLWASGAASAEAIDTVVRNSFGRRLGITGPLESADLGGLETHFNFARTLLPHLDNRPAPAAAVGRLVRSGATGAAAGRGIHDWKKRSSQALLKARMDELFRWLVEHPAKR